MSSPPRLDPLGRKAPPVGPSHDRPNPPSTQGRWRPRGPRARRCLLKGCDTWFAPVWPQARYCSDACRTAAARWRRWKAQQRYRQTAGGRACRRAQSRRRRQHQAQRRTRGCADHPSRGPAWVIAQPKIFRHLRSAWLLRHLRADSSLPVAAILCAALSAGVGTGDRTGAPVAAPLARASAPARAIAASWSGAYCTDRRAARTVGVTHGEGRWPVTTPGSCRSLLFEAGRMEDTPWRRT